MQVECLRCGEERFLDAPSRRRLDGGECPRCKYVGWAPSEKLDETLRRRVRMRPLEQRYIYSA
jgi:hypothetical protein